MQILLRNINYFIHMETARINNAVEFIAIIIEVHKKFLIILWQSVLFVMTLYSIILNLLLMLSNSVFILK